MRQKWSRLCFFVEKMEKMVLKNTNTTKRIIDHHSGIKKRVPSTALGVRTRIHHRLFSEEISDTTTTKSPPPQKKSWLPRVVCRRQAKPSLFSGRKKSRQKGMYVFWESRSKHSKTCWPFFFHSCLGFWLWKTAIRDKKAKINRDWGQTPNLTAE